MYDIIKPKKELDNFNIQINLFQYIIYIKYLITYIIYHYNVIYGYQYYLY